MKSASFKKLIKECVREVFQEEIKDILLESVRSNKTAVNESVAIATPNLSSKPSPAARESYASILNKTAADVNRGPRPFNPGANVDSTNGSLPEGEVSLDQITGLIK